MLCLSRQKSEVICIGDDIKVMVIAIKGGTVKLGIVAPDSTAVHRQEIYEKIQRAKEQGAA